jgi:integrase
MLKYNCNIYLKDEKPDKEGKVHLYGQVTFKGGKIRKNLCKVKPDHWNPLKQTFKSNNKSKSDEREVAANEKELSRFKERVENFFADARYRNYTPTPEEAKEFIKSSKEQSLGFWAFKEAWEQYINSKHKLTSKKEARSVLNFLLDFEKTTGTVLSFENQNLQFYYHLRNYCYDIRNIEQNYFAKIIKVLKSFLNWCNDMDDKTGYTGNNQRKYKKEEKTKSIVYLTPEEQQKFYGYQFENPTYAKIRDLFMFSCFTSLRISDILTLEHTHIKNNIIYKNLVKTDVSVSIPLTDEAKEIIYKYKHKPVYALPRYTEQFVNRELKDICKLLEFNEPTRIETYKGGNRKEHTQPKHELITFHTARKTFCCNCVRKGIQLHVVKKWTGHKTDSELQKYYDIEEALQIEEMSKLNFNLVP